MSKVMVGLHDYEEKNRGYARIEQIADLVTMSQKLAVFRLKRNLEVSKIVELYESLRWTEN